MNYEHLIVTPGPVATVVLNRPEARNAMSDVTLREAADAFLRLGQDRSVRAVIVTGAGKDFCAGADVAWMRRGGRLSGDEAEHDARLLAAMLRAVDECPAAVIVAAQGNVFGGGLGLLAACDVALLAENAKLCFSECRLGIMPAVISCWVLPKIGSANARRWYLTAETFGADSALAMGLAHEALPAAGLAARAAELAAAVLKCGPEAVRAAKSALSTMGGLSPAEREEFAVSTLLQLRSSPEGQEGLSAFLEKRAPKWAAKP